MIKKEITKCKTVSELVRALSPFSADCPINEMKITYEYDYPKPAKLFIEIAERSKE